MIQYKYRLYLQELGIFDKILTFSFLGGKYCVYNNLHGG